MDCANNSSPYPFLLTLKIYTMLRIFFVAVSALSISSISFAQQVVVVSETASEKKEAEEEKKPLLTISGSADVFYKFDFAKTSMNTFTSFTAPQNRFSLGMASVKLEHQSEKVGAVLDLGFGPRAKDFAYADEGITQAIKQLYVSYSPTAWLKFSAGTWATHVGYELVDPQLNRNYSMSYMFTNGPFTHTGVKAEVSKGNHGLMLGVSNATDYRIPPEDQINRKFLIAQYSVAFSENVKLFLNYAGGKSPDSSKTSQFDAVITAAFGDKFSLGYNGTVNSIQAWDGVKNLSGKSWWGSAVYVNVDPKPWFGLTARGEYFSDQNQLKVFSAAATGGNVFAATLSANFKTGGFIFIPELRFDNASETIFTDKNGAGTKSATSFVIAAIYSF